MNVGPEVCSGKRLNHSGKITKGDAPVDDESFDLMEYRQVAGIGGVEPVAATGDGSVNRQGVICYRCLKQVNLHGRGVRTHQYGLWVSEIEIHRVVHIASRMAGRQVQGFEVVPVSFNFRAFFDTEAHRHEYFLEAGTGLRHHVSMATSRGKRNLAGHHFSQIKSIFE